MTKAEFIAAVLLAFITERGISNSYSDDYYVAKHIEYAVSLVKGLEEKGIKFSDDMSAVTKF